MYSGLWIRSLNEAKKKENTALISIEIHINIAFLWYIFRCPVEDAILQYARENLVMFNIFIKDPYAKRFQKDEKITKTSYIANSGGLLGLCMGFSLISGAEILYHCFFGVYSAIFPSEKKRQRLKANSGSSVKSHVCLNQHMNIDSNSPHVHSNQFWPDQFYFAYIYSQTVSWNCQFLIRYSFIQTTVHSS